MKHDTYSVDHEIEEFELPNGDFASLKLEIDYNFYPGEPMVRYYPDGSGYPGSPDEVEIEAVMVKSAIIYPADGVTTSHEANETELFAIQKQLDGNQGDELWQSLEELCFRDAENRAPERREDRYEDDRL